MPKRTTEGAVVDEVRTRRLVVVDDNNQELAVIDSERGIASLRIREEVSGISCSAILYAGHYVDGSIVAGIELWAEGNSIAGLVLSRTEGELRVQHFG